MSRSPVAIATITWARTPEESDLLSRGLKALSAHGLPVVAADGGSPERFLEGIGSLPNVTVVPYRHGEGPRLLGQVGAALTEAASIADRILYTEPDKLLFFRDWLPALRTADAAGDPRGILIAARDEAGFSTFPAGQRLTESLFNTLAGTTIHLYGDLLYGPLILPGDLVPVVTGLTEDIGWGWRPYLFAMAQRLGRSVRLWAAPLPCPHEQRGEDDPASRLYRIKQMAQNVRGLALGLESPLEGLPGLGE